MRNIVFIASLLLTSISLAQVYQSIDADGKLVFTDRPSEGAKVIAIKDTNTVKPIELTPAPVKPQVAADIYSKLSISSPRDGSHIANGLIPFNVNIALSPRLLQGHSLQLFINGELHSSGGLLSRQIASIQRGEHSLSANIIDRKGKVIITAGTVNITAARPSRLINSNAR